MRVALQVLNLARAALGFGAFWQTPRGVCLTGWVEQTRSSGVSASKPVTHR